MKESTDALTKAESALANMCDQAEAKDVVSALHTACLDDASGTVKAILPHVDEIAKRQAFMAASAKVHLDVLRAILPSLSQQSFERMLLAGAANGRATTLRVMLLEGGHGRISPSSKASSPRVMAVLESTMCPAQPEPG